ncbi:MAG TPA: hypothetical protein VN516_04705 [Candidatus Baltobacteraceae bacterium]|nr:hypothetical protein [Candidatus Baltobacteraceae bacterium]
MKNQRFSLFSLFLIILSAGCASNHPTVSASRNASFMPTRADKIALTLRPNPNAEDAELGRALTVELQQESFNLVPMAEADYTLAYMMEDDSVEAYLPARNFTIESAPPQTSAQIKASASPTPPGFARPRIEGFQQSISSETVVFHSKGIRLYLYTNPKTHSGNFQIAWSGCINAGERISSEREPLLIKTLLGYFGQDYNGQVNLPVLLTPK